MTQTSLTALAGPGNEVGPVPDPRRTRFEQVFNQCHDPVLRYLVRCTTDLHDAADLQAETFLVVWRRLDDVPANDPLPWVYGVARRVLGNHRRGEQRRNNLADRLRDDLAHSVAEPAEPPADLGPLAAAFQQLPAADREILTLVAWEGLRPAELAAVLDCSPNTAGVRLHRARRRLENLLHRDNHRASVRTEGELA